MSEHTMSIESMECFLNVQKELGASDHAYRRSSRAIHALYEFLPENKALTKELLLAWRKSLEDHGYASTTVLTYVKQVNRYLDHIGACEIRFDRGKGKDISGMTFGYLTALSPTEKRDRKDIVWVCQCICGKTLELPATRLLRGNTKSCGCLQKEHLQRANKYIDQTSLRQSLEDRKESTRASSGYTGIVAKRGKWQAAITYKGKRYALGTYSDINDAIKARARGKELVRADALELLDIYTERQKFQPPLPCKADIAQAAISLPSESVNTKTSKSVVRSNNTSGYTGVSFRKGKWEARICTHGVLHLLGRFEKKELAVKARQTAEEALLQDAVLCE